MSGIRGQQTGGGKAKSLAIHRARSTFRPDRHGRLTEAAPVAVSSVSVPARAPTGLSASSRLLWKKLTQEYQLDSTAQLELLTAALQSRDMARQARETLQAEGLTTLDKQGQPRAHPLTTTLRDAQAAYITTLRVLGFPGEP